MTLDSHARTASLIVMVSLVLPLSAARAQSPEAEVLFREGRELIKAGRVAEGCDKLEASERIESSSGTLLNLGDCREKLGRLASAWAAFRKAESVSRRGADLKREAEARKRAAQLEPDLASLIIRVDQRVEGLEVRRDSELVEPAAWGVAVPVDPDTYTIVAEAPGYRPWRTTVTIGPKLKRRLVVVPRLIPKTQLPAPKHSDATEDPDEILGLDEATASTAGWGPARKVALGLAMLGAGVLGAGVHYGLRARELEAHANLRCPMAACGDSEALRINDRAQDNARRANLFYSAAGIAIASATVLWFAEIVDDETVVAPVVSSGGLGLSLGRQF
ncbi:MAG: hypothetical protein ACTHU0_18985 [Kofleriaceae bacterium]